METLEFIIYPDGRVEERVTGIVGANCSVVTEAIEAKLGIVASKELTSEHFALSRNSVANPVAQAELANLAFSQSFSQW